MAGDVSISLWLGLSGLSIATQVLVRMARISCIGANIAGTESAVVATVSWPGLAQYRSFTRKFCSVKAAARRKAMRFQWQENATRSKQRAYVIGIGAWPYGMHTFRKQP